MASDARQIRPGMTVVGSFTDEVGYVKEVRDHCLLVDRDPYVDVFVPLDAVQVVTRDLVILTIGANQIDSMNWSAPVLPATSDGQG